MVGDLGGPHSPGGQAIRREVTVTGKVANGNKLVSSDAPPRLGNPQALTQSVSQSYKMYQYRQRGEPSRLSSQCNAAQFVATRPCLGVRVQRQALALAAARETATRVWDKYSPPRRSTSLPPSRRTSTYSQE